jgi:predicted amidophosphoribosyltransferase
VPVPLHPVRIRERGYDQNRMIADSVAAQLNLPVRSDLIRRVRHTTPQSRLPDDRRLTNLAGAFEPARGSSPPAGTLLLIDDVIHTGATARGCWEALERAGADDVAVLTACG